MEKIFGIINIYMLIVFFILVFNYSCHASEEELDEKLDFREEE